MTTIKVVLRQKPKKDGTFPIAIRITEDRKTSFVYLGFTIPESQWDTGAQRVQSSHPDSQQINQVINQKLAEVSGGFSRIEKESEVGIPDPAGKSNTLPPEAGFFTCAEGYLDGLKTAGKYNQYTADKPRVKHFREFCEGGDIAFSAVTPDLLQRFQVYLTEKQGLLERSAMNHWVMVRSVFAQARKNKVLDENTYPFGKGKLSIRFPETQKAGLTKAELGKIEELDLKEPYNHARNLWLLCYYLVGARISDVLRLKWSDFRDGRLYLPGTKKKVPTEGINVPGKAAQILEGYKPFQDNTDLVFSDLRSIDPSDEFLVKRQIAFCTSRYDKFLRKHIAEPLGIQTKLTMHVARNTSAQHTGRKWPGTV